MSWLRIVAAGFVVVTVAGCGGNDDQADADRATTVPAVAEPTAAQLDAVCRSLGLAMISDMSGDMDEMQGKERSGVGTTNAKLAETITALDDIGAADTDQLAGDLKSAANPAASQAAQTAVSDWCDTHNWEL